MEGIIRHQDKFPKTIPHERTLCVPYLAEYADP